MGVIPGYGLTPQGGLGDTTVYYRDLGACFEHPNYGVKVSYERRVIRRREKRRRRKTEPDWVIARTGNDQ